MSHQIPVSAEPRGHPARPDRIMRRPPLRDVFRSDLAQTEGWDVFDCGLREDGMPRVEIQRIDSPEVGEPVFANDGDTWRHVVARARAGSALHRRALRMVDPIERMLIEASFGSRPEPPR